MCGGRDLARNCPRIRNTACCRSLAETGTDLSKWPTEKHFTAWSGLAPGNNDSGKRKGGVSSAGATGPAGCSA